MPFIQFLRADRPHAFDSHQFQAAKAKPRGVTQEATKKTRVSTSARALDLSSQSMDFHWKPRHSLLSKLDQFTGQFDNSTTCQDC
ncbi:MAG TPA: hypothetical protein DCF63_03195 [Planctomycetaceae bacterium]|nr:hypothetical protein [Planctomycetaceae bacterium]